MALITVKPSLEKTADSWAGLLNRIPALYAGVPAEQILQAAQLEKTGAWKLNANLRRNIDRLRYHSHILDLSSTDQFQFTFPTEVFVYTTRGGKWPERREEPCPNGCRSFLSDDNSWMKTTAQMQQAWTTAVDTSK